MVAGDLLEAGHGSGESTISNGEFASDRKHVKSTWRAAIEIAEPSCRHIVVTLRYAFRWWCGLEPPISGRNECREHSQNGGCP